MVVERGARVRRRSRRGAGGARSTARWRAPPRPASGSGAASSSPGRRGGRCRRGDRRAAAPRRGGRARRSARRTCARRRTRPRPRPTRWRTSLRARPGCRPGPFPVRRRRRRLEKDRIADLVGRRRAQRRRRSPRPSRRQSGHRPRGRRGAPRPCRRRAGSCRRTARRRSAHGRRTPRPARLARTGSRSPGGRHRRRSAARRRRSARRAGSSGSGLAGPMWTTSVARRAASESWSASLTATIDSMPSSRQARTIRTAISPRLATSTRRMAAALKTMRRPERSRRGLAPSEPPPRSHSRQRPPRRDARLDVVHQLHHLDDAECRRSLDRVADVRERRQARLGRAPEDARRRRHDDVGAGRWVRRRRGRWIGSSTGVVG